MQTITDPEFGEISVRRVARSSHVRIRLTTKGRFSVSAPSYTPLFFIRKFIDSSRDELRKMAAPKGLVTEYAHGQQIGKSHTLAVVSTGMVTEPTLSRQRQKLIVKLPHDIDVTSADVQRLIRDEVAKILRVEAKAHLPRRLRYLADTHGFEYERVRFSHAGSRWGSCSSTGTISLNIALMKLPDELIDYVLIHELCHTRHMDHSAAFWAEVAKYDPHYRLHRRQIKQQTPTV